MMLTAIFLPHHHHEETACYTSTHCEEGVRDHEYHAEEPLDHHHEHNTPDESQNCLTFNYYVFSDSGRTFKRTVEYKIKVHGHHHLHIYCLDYAEDEPSFEAVFKKSGILTIHNYTAVLRHELPMRAPPARIT